MGQFADAVKRFADQAKLNADQACRAVALQLTTRVVLASPVGNPDLWKANAEAALQRSQHNVIVDQINANLLSNPANIGPKGGLKRSVRSRYNKRLSESQRAKLYPFKAGENYAGGRLRGSWQVTIGEAPAGDIVRIDPSGGQAIAAASAALSTFTAGPPIYIVSNAPHAIPVEYGHSTQAPSGMVRITLAAFDQIVNEALSAAQ
jgi:hypothetical protein